MAGQQQMGWSPNPIYNQPALPPAPQPSLSHHHHGHHQHAPPPVHQAAAPTPLGIQAHALMSPTTNSPMSPLEWGSSQAYHTFRSPGPGIPMSMGMSMMSPGPGPSMLLKPGKFEHYVPSVRYNPTDVNYGYGGHEGEEDEDDDGFVIVEEKERIPRPRKRQIGRESRYPCGLLKGVKNIFLRKQESPAPVMTSLPAGFQAWPNAPYELHDEAPPTELPPPTNNPTAVPYSPGTRTYATWTAGMMSPRSTHHSVFHTFRSPDAGPSRALQPPPPKPPDWSHADPTRPSWACVLHPLLTHRAAGAPVVHFDLRLPVEAITLLPAHPHMLQGPTPLTPAQLESHATWPPCAELTIASVADEPLFPSSFNTTSTFPWPIHVHAHDSEGGVKVGDVLAALAESAMLHVRPGEYNALSPARREQVKLSYWARCAANRNREGEGEGDEAQSDDGCRRIDVLGTRVMFRGLEPAHGMDGTWVMFLGPP